MESEMTHMPLKREQVKGFLQDLPLWTLNSMDKLEREFVFKSFPEAFSFMTRVAFEAERLGHHPDWQNSYNRVRIELSTHDAGGVTEKDIELARHIERINWV